MVIPQLKNKKLNINKMISYIRPVIQQIRMQDSNYIIDHIKVYHLRTMM